MSDEGAGKRVRSTAPSLHPSSRKDMRRSPPSKASYKPHTSMMMRGPSPVQYPRGSSSSSTIAESKELLRRGVQAWVQEISQSQSESAAHHQVAEEVAKE
eukprot:1258661-Karenia_brevis.AAC.1